MQLYGLYGFTHGWGRLLTVMSPEGAAAVRAHVAAGAGIEVTGGEDGPVRFYEKRRGALAGLVETYGIVVLEKPAWDTKKRELGDSIL